MHPPPPDGPRTTGANRDSGGLVWGGRLVGHRFQRSPFLGPASSPRLGLRLGWGLSVLSTAAALGVGSVPRGAGPGDAVFVCAGGAARALQPLRAEVPQPDQGLQVQVRPSRAPGVRCEVHCRSRTCGHSRLLQRLPALRPARPGAALPSLSDGHCLSSLTTPCLLSLSALGHLLCPAHGLGGWTVSREQRAVGVLPGVGGLGGGLQEEVATTQVGGGGLAAALGCRDSPREARGHSLQGFPETSRPRVCGGGGGGQVAVVRPRGEAQWTAEGRVAAQSLRAGAEVGAVEGSGERLLCVLDVVPLVAGWTLASWRPGTSRRGSLGAGWGCSALAAPACCPRSCVPTALGGPVVCHHSHWVSGGRVPGRERTAEAAGPEAGQCPPAALGPGIPWEGGAAGALPGL